MRLAYVCADQGVPVFGRKGASIHVQEVTRAFVRLGIEVELFAANADGEPPSDFPAVRLHRLPALAKGDRAAREKLSLAANGDLLSALRQAGPFDLVYERYSLWSFAGMEYARSSQVPGLLEVNAPLIEEQAEYRGLVDRASAEQVAERVFTAASALLAVSDEIRSYLDQYPAARALVHVIPNGVNPDRFPANLPATLPGPPGTLTVGFIGSLKPWHGLSDLLAAFALLHAGVPATRLLIVGDGPQREDLVADAAARGLSEAVHFTGAVAPAEVPGWLASMDVAVAPYPKLANCYFSPLKVYEYMAAGRAVVASRVGQLADLIEHGVNGLLCPPGDPAALAAVLDRLRGDLPLRTQLGRAARAAVLQNHTWDARVRSILHLTALQPAPVACGLSQLT